MSIARRCAWCAELVAGQAHDHALSDMFPDWQSRARCATSRDLSIDDFFPERGQSNRAAMRLCFACPVRRECLSLALRRPEKLGIWGGSTEQQRAGIRRLRASHTESLEMALEITEDAARRRRLAA